MATITPASARHTANLLGQELTINIPSHKQWLQLPFLAFWLMIWTFGELAAINGLATNGIKADSLFTLVWVVLWTIAGATSWITIFWIIFGREIITTNGQKTFTHRWEILGIGQSKEYDIAFVSDLRATSAHLRNIRPKRRSALGWQDFNAIAFDYGSKTICIGNSLDEAEAKQIIRTLHNHIPSLPLLNKRNKNR